MWSRETRKEYQRARLKLDFINNGGMFRIFTFPNGDAARSIPKVALWRLEHSWVWEIFQMCGYCGVVRYVHCTVATYSVNWQGGTPRQLCRKNDRQPQKVQHTLYAHFFAKTPNMRLKASRPFYSVLRSKETSFTVSESTLKNALEAYCRGTFGVFNSIFCNNSLFSFQSLSVTYFDSFHDVHL